METTVMEIAEAKYHGFIDAKQAAALAKRLLEAKIKWAEKGAAA